MEKTTRPTAPLPGQPQPGCLPGELPVRNPGEVSGGGAGGTLAKPAQLTSFGTEGALLYQKRIDNSAVHYRYDPRDRDFLRWQVSLGLFLVLMVLIATAPRLWVRHSGYRQAKLSEKIEQLIVVRDRLIVEKGHREDLSRVAEYATRIGLRETDEARYTWFAPESAETETAVARLFNREEQR